MFTAVFLITRKAGTTREDFVRRWTGSHRDMALKLPGLLRFRQRYATQAEDYGAYDGIVEITFESEAAFLKARSSGEFAAATEDGDDFVDVSKLVMIPVSTENVFDFEASKRSA